MAIDRKILEEITRFKSINNYITEQEVPPPPADLGAPPADLGAPPADPLAPPADPLAPPAGAPPAGAPPAGDLGTPPPAPVDVATDKDVEEIGGEGNEDGEKLEITDLVVSQKNMEQKQEEYFNNLFNQLKTLEEKLGDMDQLVSKIDGLENKIENLHSNYNSDKQVDRVQWSSTICKMKKNGKNCTVGSGSRSNLMQSSTFRLFDH